MTSVSDSEFEVRVFNPRGFPLRDIRVHPTYSFVLNDLGDCMFQMSTSDPAFREETIQFGNWIVINHTHLPSWVGMIESDLSRTWNNGWVDVYAVGAERVFDNLIVYPLPDVRGTPGEILSYLVRLLKEDRHTDIPINLGNVVQGGRPIYYPIMGRAGEVMRFIYQEARAEFSVSHEIDNDGRLNLLANLYGQKGTDTQATLNESNTDLKDAILVEDGEIWNHVVFMTSARSGGNDFIVGDPQRDEDSIAKFGIRMYLGEVAAQSVEGLNSQAQIFLYANAWPIKRVTPTVLNVDDIWRQLDTGNLFYWEHPLVGFTGGSVGAREYVRMSGMEVNLKEAKVDVMVEHFDGSYTWRQIWNALYG